MLLLLLLFVHRTLENGERRTKTKEKIALNFNGTGNKRVVSGYCSAENGVAQKVFQNCTIDNCAAHSWDGALVNPQKCTRFS